jgi:cellulose synthase/poly-beta-1,6-N-acetylglucosamine synthase-like glycosyltransferase
VIVHAEAAQIDKLLAALLNQHLHRVEIAELIVVASACDANTIATLQAVAAQAPQMQIIEQASWQGSAAALNLFLAACTTTICVIEHSATLPHEQAVENLVRIFADPTIGMVGAQKVLLGTPAYMAGFLTHLRMRMEHLLCLEIPRMREMVAFRKLFDELPLDVTVDEALVEALVVRAGLLVRYAPDAIVYSSGPTTIPAMIDQRRQNYAAYLQLQQKYGYTVGSLRRKPIIKVALKELWEAVRLVWVLVLLAGLEAWSRVMGWYDFAVRRNRHVIWEMAWTQKQDVQRARAAQKEDGRNG